MDETTPLYTPSPDDLIDDVKALHEELRQFQLDHQANKREILIERSASIRSALAGGVTAIKLAEVLGVNRSRIYQMRDAGRK